MEKMKLNNRISEILRYIIVGILSVGIHYFIYFLTKIFLPLNLSYSLGFVVALIFSYIASSRFTFSSSLSFKKFLGFCMSHAINYTIQFVVLNTVLKLGINENLAPLPVFAVSVPINFLLVRFVLKNKKKNY